MKKVINVLILSLLVFAYILLLSITVYAKETGPSSSDFIIGVAVVPGNWITDINTDMKNISRIANVISVSGGKYKSFQSSKLKPTLDTANKCGLKVILCYYRIQDGNTSLEELAAKFGNHPAVIGFKVQDELGSNGEPSEQLLTFLKNAKQAIRKHSDKPIMFDVIPWEFWSAGNKSFEKKYPGSKNSAIDSYINAGGVDWVMISVSERSSSIPVVLPKAVARWGDKVKIIVRTSASFKGDSYTLNVGSDPVKVRQRTMDAFNNGANGIYFYAWQHSTYRLLNKDGSSNPLFEEMQETFKSFRNKIK